MNSSNVERVKKYGVYNIVDYESDNASDVIDKFKAGMANAICIAPWRGFKEDSLDCLVMLEELKVVVIQGFPTFSLEALEHLPQLVELSIDETKHSLDFMRLKRLSALRIDWHKKLFKNVESSNLSSLHLWKFKSVVSDMTDFPAFNYLRDLRLIQSTITSLNGISKFRKLNRIELHHLSKLEKFGELNLPELKAFRADHCKKMTDHEQLGACLDLEDLDLHSCGSMKSVQFIQNLRKLKSFRFMDTDVVDGDLTPLLGLDDVFFTEKKHFSHKTNAFDQVIDGVKVVKK